MARRGSGALYEIHYTTPDGERKGMFAIGRALARGALQDLGLTCQTAEVWKHNEGPFMPGYSPPRKERVFRL